MIESSVVLPEPDGPSSATTSPAATSIEIPFRTSTRCRPSSNTFVTSVDRQHRRAHGVTSRPEDEGGVDARDPPEAEEQPAPRHMSTVPTKTAAGSRAR